MQVGLRTERMPILNVSFGTIVLLIFNKIMILSGPSVTNRFNSSSLIKRDTYLGNQVSALALIKTIKASLEDFLVFIFSFVLSSGYRMVFILWKIHSATGRCLYTYCLLSVIRHLLSFFVYKCPLCEYMHM